MVCPRIASLKIDSLTEQQKILDVQLRSDDGLPLSRKSVHGYIERKLEMFTVAL